MSGAVISIADYRRLGGALRCAATPKRRTSSGFLSKQATADRPAVTEEQLHRSCIEWVELHKNKYPLLNWLIHVPNGGKRSKAEAGKLKAMGVRPGVPDLLLPRRNGWYMGLAIELKTASGRLSEEQNDWLDMFKSEGFCMAVCRSLDEFIEVVTVYLEGSHNDWEN